MENLTLQLIGDHLPRISRVSGYPRLQFILWKNIDQICCSHTYLMSIIPLKGLVRSNHQVTDDLKIADGIVEKIVQKTVDLGIEDESHFVVYF